MIILGIDPGTGRTGWGIIKKVKSLKLKVKSFNGLVLVDYGCILTPKEKAMSERLYFIQKTMRQLLRQYKPDCVVVEELFFGINSRTAMSVGQARGVIMATAAQHKLPVFEYQCLRVKLALSGYGRADKKTIQKKVRQFLGFSPKKMSFRAKDGGDDAADALAVAIYHACLPAGLPAGRPFNTSDHVEKKDKTF